MRKAPEICVALVLAAVLVSCDGNDGSADATSAPEEPATTTVADGSAVAAGPITPLVWTRCGAAECASLTVPLDHDDPSEGSVALAVARRPAKRPAERIGVLLFNPGGPGVPATPIIVEAAPYTFSSTLLDRFDVVSWDPRGVSAGTEVDCVDDLNRFLAPDPTPETAEEAALIEELFNEFAAGCTERSGEMLPRLSTVSTARDMDLLRAALGEEKISYLGNSYGAALGAVYVTLFPERVRAMVLDGAYDLSAPYPDVWMQKLQAQERALDAALQGCATTPSCAFHSNGDPFTAFDALLASIDRDPLIVGEMEVGLGHALWAVYWGLMSEQQWPYLMNALDQARDGNGSLLIDLADPGDLLVESYFGISCLDGPATAWPRSQSMIDEARAVAPRLGPFHIEARDLCRAWPADPDPVPPLTGASAPPVLVVGTTGDIATPLEAGRDLADRIESGILLVVERNYHTAYEPLHFGARCVTEAVDHYLVDLETPPDLSVCQHREPQLQPPD